MLAINGRLLLVSAADVALWSSSVAFVQVEMLSWVNEDEGKEVLPSSTFDTTMCCSSKEFCFVVCIVLEVKVGPSHQIALRVELNTVTRAPTQTIICEYMSRNR